MTSTVYVPHSGPENAQVLIVGESPGSDETRTKQPFVGASGELLRQVLFNNGFPCASSADIEYAFSKKGTQAARDLNNQYNIRFANLVNYQPEGNKFDNFTESEVNIGLQELDEYIQKWKSNIRICIAVGGMPLQYIVKKYGIENWRGSVVKVGGVTVLATYHPSYVVRNRSNYGVFAQDIAKAHRIFSEGYKFPELDYKVVSSGYDLEEVIHECKAFRELSTDIETIKHTNRILCVGVAISAKTAFVIPNTATEGLDSTCRRFCTEVIEDVNIEQTYHNGAFDVEIFNNNQVKVGNFKHDTRIMQHVLAPELPASLSFITSIFTDIPYYKDKGKMTLPENEKGWSDTKKLDRMTLYEYNAWDCVSTWQCKEAMLKEIAENKNFSYIYPQEMSMHELSFELTRNGMLLDQERRTLLRDAVRAKYVEDQRMLNAILNGKVINVGSWQQKRELFYKIWGLPVRNNEKGEISTDDDAITSLVGWVKEKINSVSRQDTKFEYQKKLAGLITVKKLVGHAKLLGSYLEVEEHPDGRVRSTYNIPGTETARWSCSKYLDDTGLNAQTMPRDYVDVPN